MQFKRILMRRVFGVGDVAVEYEFPQTNGITQIKAKNYDTGGSNAGGKSTLIEGIFFALTGRTVRKVKKMEDYLHDLSDCDGLVELEFDNIKIVRRILPSKKVPGYELWVDGKNLTINSSKAETKKLIDKYVGINFETLSNIIVFGQHNMFSFLEAGEAEKREIVENLMNLAEYNLYEEKARKAHNDTKATLKGLAEKHKITEDTLIIQQQMHDEQDLLRTKHRDVILSAIKLLETEEKQLPDVSTVKEDWGCYDAYLARRSQMEKQIGDLKELRNAATEHLNSVLHQMRGETNNKYPLMEKVRAVAAKFAKLDAMKAEKIAALEEIKTQIKAKEREIQVLEFDTEDAIRKIVPSKDWDASINAMVARQVDAQKQMQAILAKKLSDKDVCPTCYGIIDIANADGVIIKLRTEIKSQYDWIDEQRKLQAEDIKLLVANRSQIKAKEAIQKELYLASKVELEQQLAKELTAINEEYDAAVARLTDMKQAAEQKVKDFDDSLQAKYGTIVKAAENERLRLITAVNDLTRELSEVKVASKPTVTLEQVGTIQAQRESIRKQIAEKHVAVQANPYDEIIRSLSVSIADIAAKVKDIESEIALNEEKLPYYEFWAEAMGKEGIKSFIIDKIIPTLNQQIEYWLQSTYQGAISLTFDKFLEVRMKNNASGNEMVFGQGSGGEQKRVDIAIMLSFRDIMKMSSGKNPNILFFDEVAESLDDHGIYHLYNTIKETAKDSRIFVITHHPTLNALLEDADKLQFQKRQGAITRDG